MSRLYIIVLFFAATAYAADKECECINDITGDEKLWKYLKQMSIDVSDEEREMYSVIPELISINCECDKNREKRKANSKEIQVPEIPAAPEVSEEDESEEASNLSKLLARRIANTRNCARGYVRVGFICVLQEDFLE